MIKFEKFVPICTLMETTEITELRHQLAAQHRYIEELERQLEPSVIEEIRAELDAKEEII
jgi:hypothetical protein